MQLILFYVSGGIAITTAILAVTRLNASHALIYLVVTLLSLAVIFFLLGAPFAAALEIVIYAGAIVVLFLFVVMMLNLGRHSVDRERQWLVPGMWIGPALLAGLLFSLLVAYFAFSEGPSGGNTAAVMVDPKSVGESLFGPYVIAVELAGILLLAALVGAYHLGRRYLADRRDES